jgi:hypothetical protein
MAENTEKDLYQKIIVKCWSDDAFKQRLLSDTAATLKAEGIELPAGITVAAVENTAQKYTIVIPPSPSALSDDELAGVAGGKGCGFTCEHDLQTGLSVTEGAAMTAAEVAAAA